MSYKIPQEFQAANEKSFLTRYLKYFASALKPPSKDGADKMDP